jgi:hypothetical protein
MLSSHQAGSLMSLHLTHDHACVGLASQATCMVLVSKQIQQQIQQLLATERLSRQQRRRPLNR